MIPCSLLLMMVLQGSPQGEELRERVELALKDSSSAGGFKIRGRVEEETPFGNTGGSLPGLEHPVRGTFSGETDGEGAIFLRFIRKEAQLELYRRGEKAIQRGIWRGKFYSSDSFSREVIKLSSPRQLLSLLGGATAWKLLGDPEKGLVQVSFRLPGPAFSGKSEGLRILEPKSVDITVSMEKKDHLLREIRAVITRGFAVLPETEGRKAPGKPRSLNDVLGQKFRRIYVIQYENYGKIPPLSFPEEVEQWMEPEMEKQR